MLRHLLNQHVAIACAGELIANDVGTIFPPSRVYRLLPFKSALIRSVFFKRARINAYLKVKRTEPIVGFKVLYEQVPPALLGTLEKRVDRFILILRRDRIRRTLSLLKARKTNQWNLLKEKATAPLKDAPFNMDVSSLIYEVELSEKCDTAWITRLQTLGARGLTITYENLVRNREGVVADVLAFLGLRASAASMLVPKTLRMTSPAPLSELIVNYSELLKSTAGTRIERMLIESEWPLD